MKTIKYLSSLLKQIKIHQLDLQLSSVRMKIILNIKAFRCIPFDNYTEKIIN